MQLAHQEASDAAEAHAVEHDREIAALANDRRIAGGKPALTPEQEAEMMARRAAERAGKS
jgi:hypothetical protein